MKYNIVKLVRNTQDQYVAQDIDTKDDIDKAKVAYHQTLAAFHNANDVKKATVQILDENGYKVEGFFEIVDHTQSVEE